MAEIRIVNTIPDTTLDGSINNSVTSLDVAAGTGTDFGAAPFKIGIGDEAMLCTAITTDTLTVTRNYDGTAAASHTDGDTVKHIHSAEDFPYRIDTGVYMAQGDIDFNDHTLYGAPMYAENSGEKGAVSTSAFAWKGTCVVPHHDVRIHGIVLIGTVVSGADYQAAVVTYSGTTVSTITKSATETASAVDAEATNATMMMMFATPVALTDGTEYVLMVGRTDDTDAHQLPVQYPSGDRFAFPFGALSTNASIRIAKASPAVSDTVDLFTAGVVRIGALWSLG